MQLIQRIDAFAKLGKFLGQIAMENKHPILEKAEAENGWFTNGNLKFALNSWSEALSKENIQQWASAYKIEEIRPKTIAVVMAGNVPLVGFHDFLSVLVTGNKVLAKLSSNDKTLLPFLSQNLIEIEPEFNNYIEFAEGKLENFDAVIATGSNNTSKYFEYYFGKYPGIIRKNRNSVAVLNGNETEEELSLLANDIFQYFGLGCRNVSKLYVPEKYDFESLFKAMVHWHEITQSHKYSNNYNYNKAVYLMGSLPFLDNEFLLLKEDPGFSSPISVVFYEKYTSAENVRKQLEEQSEKIQCVVSNTGIKNEIPFGKAQRPGLWEYADGVDTVDFLLKLP